MRVQLDNAFLTFSYLFLHPIYHTLMSSSSHRNGTPTCFPEDCFDLACLFLPQNPLLSHSSIQCLFFPLCLDSWSCPCLLSHFSHVGFLGTYGLWPTRLLCPWDSCLENPTPVGCHALLQGISLTQGSKPTSLTSAALAGGFFTTSATWEAHSWPHPLLIPDLFLLILIPLGRCVLMSPVFLVIPVSS